MAYTILTFKREGSSSWEEDLSPAREACGRGLKVGLVFEISGGWSLMTAGDKWVQTIVHAICACEFGMYTSEDCTFFQIFDQFSQFH